jgi:hypothetical protein
MKTTQTRAPKNGTVGKNGYYYYGGEFLPTTTLAPMTKAARGGDRKPSAYWQRIRAFVAMDATTMRITASDDSLAFYGETRAAVQGICDRYNGGER